MKVVFKQRLVRLNLYAEEVAKSMGKFRLTNFGMAVAILVSSSAASASVSGSPPHDLVVNGSFEQGPPISGEYADYGTNSTDITGWTVTSGSVGVCQQPAWGSKFGSRCLELNGSVPGSITQKLSTETGATYQLKFWVAGNVEGGPPIKPVYVRVPGKSGAWKFDCTGHDKTRLGWTPVTWQFTALDGKTPLEFGSMVTSGPYGPIIDNVSVVKIKDAPPRDSGPPAASVRPPDAAASEPVATASASTPTGAASTPTGAASTPTGAASTPTGAASTSDTSATTVRPQENPQPAESSTGTSIASTSEPAQNSSASGTGSRPEPASLEEAEALLDSQWEQTCNQLEKLVKQYYPKANFSIADDVVHFDFKSKEVTGYYGDAMVPLDGGIVGEVALKIGPPAHPAPKEKKDFQNSCATLSKNFYSHACRSYLESQLSYRIGTSTEFKNKFLAILNRFKDEGPEPAPAAVQPAATATAPATAPASIEKPVSAAEAAARANVLFAERKQISELIEQVRLKGTNVTNYSNALKYIESRIRAGDSESALQHTVADLIQQLTDEVNGVQHPVVQANTIIPSSQTGGWGHKSAAEQYIEETRNQRNRMEGSYKSVQSKEFWQKFHDEWNGSANKPKM